MKWTRLSTVLGLALLVALPACYSSEQRFERHMKAAEAYQKEGKVDEAELEFKSALKIRPQDASVNLKLAKLELRSGNLANGIFYLREAHRLAPDDPEAPLSLAALLMGSNRKEAKQLVAEVLKRHPENALAHVRQSEIDLLDRDANGALQEALTAVQLDGSSAESWLALGRVHMARIREAMLAGKEPSKDLLERATKALTKAEKLEGPGGYAQVDLARVIAATPGKEEEGKQALRKAIRAAADAGHIDAMETGIRDLLRRSGPANFEVRRFVLRCRVDADPADLRSWKELARFSELNKPGQGEVVYEELLKKRPQDVGAAADFVDFLDERKGAAVALARLDALPKEIRQAPPIRGRKVALLLELGRVADAKSTLSELDVKSSGGLESTLAHARIDLAEKNLDGAIEALENVANSNDPRVFYLLALAQRDHLHPQKAGEAMDQAIKALHSFDRRIFDDAVKIYYTARRWQSVVQSVTEFVKQGEQVPEEDLVKLADAEYRLGAVAQARKAMEHLLQNPDPSTEVLRVYAENERKANPDRVRELIDGARKRHPDDLELIRLRWLVDRTPQELQASLQQVDGLIQHGQDDRATRFLRAQMRTRLRMYDGTLEDLTWILDRYPDAPLAQQLLVNLLRTPAPHDQVIAELEKCRAKGVLGAPGLEALAAEYGRKGNTAEQMQILEGLVKSNPDLAGPKNDLAYLLAEQGKDLDRALDLARQAVAAAPKNANIADTLGYIYYKRGLYQPALEQLDSATEVMSKRDDRALIQYHRSLVLTKLGREKEAAQALAKAKEIAPGRNFPPPTPN